MPSANAHRNIEDDGRRAQAKPSAETLLALVENRGQLLDKDDLMNVVWRDTAVEEANLTQNISVLRRVPGEIDRTVAG